MGLGQLGRQNGKCEGLQGPYLNRKRYFEEIFHSIQNNGGIHYPVERICGSAESYFIKAQ